MRTTVLIGALVLLSVIDGFVAESEIGKITASLEFLSPVYLNNSDINNLSLLLTCKYDLNGGKLYTLKMFRGTCNFYAFVPSSSTGTLVRHYDCPNVDVNRTFNSKTNNEVMLKGIGIGSQDEYRCEVSTDMPNFDTKTVYKTLHILIKPSKKPVLSLEKKVYNLGDTLEASCTSKPSFPEQQLTWIVNGAPLSKVYYTNEAKTTNDPYLNISVSKMSFGVARSHFSYIGKLTIQCMSNIDKFYRRKVTAVVNLNMTNVALLPDDHLALETKNLSNSSNSQNILEPCVSSTIFFFTIHLLTMNLKSIEFSIT